MSEVIAFIAGVIVARAIIGPVPYRVQMDIRTLSVATSHLNDTARRMLTALQGIERQLELSVSHNRVQRD